MRFQPAHQSMINRRHDGRASCRARQCLKHRLKQSHEFARLLLEKADMRVDKIGCLYPRRILRPHPVTSPEGPPARFRLKRPSARCAQRSKCAIGGMMRRGAEWLSIDVKRLCGFAVSNCKSSIGSRRNSTRWSALVCDSSSCCGWAAVTGRQCELKDGTPSRVGARR